MPIEPLHGLFIKIQWSAAVNLPAFPPAEIKQPTNAIAVLRGPLLYSLYLEEQCSGVVKTWAPFNNTDINLVTDSDWK